MRDTFRFLVCFAVLWGCLTTNAWAQTTPRPGIKLTDDPPVVTKHSTSKGWSYTATAGFIPLKTAADEIEARLFYIAYTREDMPDKGKRPLVIAFNGGPGSASVWLHLGAIGPKRVPLKNGGEMPPPPFALVENAHTWLEFADLVFLDPIGTGYSRAASSEVGTRYWGLTGDIASITEAIRLYLSRNERWGSPLYLAGESYGTMRAAGLAGQLVDNGIALNGVVLISTILNYQTARFNTGNDLPYILFLPTYTATAFYHKKLPTDLQRDLTKTLAEVEQFAEGEYATALMKGDKLTESERKTIAKKVARYTGLAEKYVQLSDLRLSIFGFTKELLRDDGWSVGRLDSRIKGRDRIGLGTSPDFDPSEAAIRPPYTATFNQYIRSELNFKTDLEYYILGGGIGRWEYPQNQYADTSELLRRALAKNPYLKVFVAEGFYDLATPYFAAEYTLTHMNRPTDLKKNFTIKRYEAGHMMYIHEPSLERLTREVAEWMSTP
jgi:carboxypeptidase C (cathepsin A)